MRGKIFQTTKIKKKKKKTFLNQHDFSCNVKLDGI